MDIIDKYNHIVNDKTGIVKSIYKKNNEVIHELIHYTGVINNPVFSASKEDEKKRYTVVCGGTSFDDSMALSKCLGECLERYAALNINYKNFISGSYNQLTEKGYRCIHVREFSYFSDNQYLELNFPFKKITDDTTLYWVIGKDLYSKANVLIPAELIFLNHVEKFSINHNISTGQACGETLNDAIITAIYEVIERDSFIMTWKKKISFPHINIKTIDDNIINKMIEKFYNSNMEVWLVRIEMEYGIPTVMGILLNNNINYRNVLIETSTKSTYKKAIVSVLESLANLLMINTSAYRRGNKDIKYNAINNLEDRISIFMNPDVWNETDFLFEGDSLDYNDLIIEDEKNNCKNCNQLIDENISKLYKHGINAYYCDITTVDIKQLGFNIVQVLMPELLSIDISSNYMYLGGRRLMKANELFNNYKHINDINYFPHPFL